MGPPGLPLTLEYDDGVVGSGGIPWGYPIRMGEEDYYAHSVMY